MKKITINIQSIILLVIFFILSGCSESSFNENIKEVEAGIKSKKITFDDFKKNKKAFALVAGINKKQIDLNSHSNNINNSRINNFIVDTQNGLYLEYSNLHSFTFAMYREYANGKQENLVLSLQRDGSYKVKIIQYDLTAQEQIDVQNNQLKHIKNPVVSLEIENFSGNFKTNSCESVPETIWVACSQGVHNSSNINSWASCEAAVTPKVYTVSRIVCISSDGSGTGGGPPIYSGFGDNYGTGGGSYPANYPTTETNPDEYEDGISAPILTTENYENLRNINLFNQSLTPAQTQWSAEHLISHNFILNLVKNKNWTDESKTFGRQLIDLAISANLNIFTNNNLSFEFNNLGDFEQFINFQEDLNIVSVATPFQVDKKITNRNIKIAPLLDLRLQIVIIPSPNFSLDETNSTTFLESTLLPGNSWSQTAFVVTKSSSNLAGTTAEITITGYINIGVKIGDYEIGVKRLKEIIVSIDKNTGDINYTKVKNLN